MGMFDKLKQKATGAASEHPDKVSQGLDKAGDLVDKRTGGKHSDAIDSGVEKAEGALGIGAEDTPGNASGEQSGQSGHQPGAQSDHEPGDRPGRGQSGPGVHRSDGHSGDRPGDENG